MRQRSSEEMSSARSNQTPDAKGRADTGAELSAAAGKLRELSVALQSAKAGAALEAVYGEYIHPEATLAGDLRAVLNLMDRPPLLLARAIDSDEIAALQPGAVTWHPDPLGPQLAKARWNIRWLIKIAHDARLSAQERVGIIANFPAEGIEPVEAPPRDLKTCAACGRSSYEDPCRQCVPW